MKHFVVIRFNFQPDDPYLDLRKRFLYEVSMHSLKRQTNQNFKVAVITNLDVKSDILIEPRNKFRPLECPGLTAQLPAYHAPDEYVMTTRLDMDDVLLPTFIDEVQKSFRPKDGYIIDTCGYNYDVRNNKMIYTSPRLPSNFLTYVEYGEDPKYCYHKKHPEMRVYKVHKIRKPLRIFCFHDNSKLMSRFKPGVYTKGPSIDTRKYKYYIDTLREINNLMKERMRDERLALC